MANGQAASALRQLRALFSAGTTTGLTDSELLERFRARRAECTEAATAAEMAFAALVNRHGAMVWGVCRRVLRDVHEAEDAFQATFLILVRKSGSVRVQGSLGRWLYGVAHRVALRARARPRAGQLESRVARVPSPTPEDPALESELKDLRRALDEELDRLPTKYRCPIELCHLQGLTYDQAAQQLNWPVATVKSRLIKGRLRMRERLVRRGLAPGALGAARALTGEARSAVAQELIHGTVRAASSSAIGVFPAEVVDLVEGVLNRMAWEKVKLVAVGALVAVVLTAQAVSQQAPNKGIHANRPAEAAPRVTGKPSEKTVDDRRWVRSLPSGETIEVIGVSSFPSGPETWWRPDGSPLHPAPCDRIETGGTGPKSIQRSVVVRLTGVPDGADQSLSITEAHGLSRGPAKRDDKPVPGLIAMTASLPIGTRTCTVRFSVAAGPWHTELTAGKGSGAFGTATTGYIFGDAIATRKGTSLAVTHDLKGMALRLLALDGDGKQHPGVIGSSLGVKDFQQIKIEFELPPEQIQNFLLQTRPYQELEIPGIALEPGA